MLKSDHDNSFHVIETIFLKIDSFVTILGNNELQQSPSGSLLRVNGITYYLVTTYRIEYLQGIVQFYNR